VPSIERTFCVLPLIALPKHQLEFSTKSHFHVHLVVTRSKMNYNMSTFLFHPPGLTVNGLWHAW